VGWWRQQRAVEVERERAEAVAALVALVLVVLIVYGPCAVLVVSKVVNSFTSKPADLVKLVSPSRLSRLFERSRSGSGTAASRRFGDAGSGTGRSSMAGGAGVQRVLTAGREYVYQRRRAGDGNEAMCGGRRYGRGLAGTR
jgi:uncharacterized membrane protein YgcG